MQAKLAGRLPTEHASNETKAWFRLPSTPYGQETDQAYSTDPKADRHGAFIQ